MKAIAGILAGLCFVSIFLSGLFLIYNQAIVYSDSYYEVSDFEYNYAKLVYSAIDMNVKLKSEDNIKAMKESYKIKEDKVNQFRHYKNIIDNTVNFKYYIRNTSTGESVTNVRDTDPAAFIEKQPESIYISRETFKYNLPMYGVDILEMLSGEEYEVYAAIQYPLQPGDRFYDSFMEYSTIKSLSAYAYPLLITAAILLVISAAYLAYTTGRRESGGEIILHPIDRLYTDVYSLLVLGAACISVIAVANILIPRNVISWIGFAIVLSIDAAIGIPYVLSMIRQCKAGCIFKNTAIAVLYKKTREITKLCFDGKVFRPSVLLVLLGYGLMNGILFDIGVDLNQGDQEPIFTVLLILFNAAAVYFAARVLASLSNIMEAAKQISSGNTDYTLKSSEMPVVFKGLAEDIMYIQGGLKKAVAEAIKGERMKTELITNVSHDLKTPLTSIVNYVDLLKNEQLDNERAVEYINVLEEKSARLKQLVEDLVEVSKASSGNMTVNAEKVDLHELVMQAFGEYEEKIEKAELDVRINAEEKNIYVYADGKQLWRIIENLLSNAVKYSMPKSRVYIDLRSGNEYGSLIIKNISAFPLDIPPEQLTERFVRGDASRTTEGSGLGLSIAQSLTALQGGSFNIGIDGDLFKVSVDIPLCMEA